MEKPNFTPKKCEHCQQDLEYLIPVDHGTVAILKAIAVKIGNKKINIVHPRKEMETSSKMPIVQLIINGLLTSNMVGNLSRPRMHGLIARIKGESGNYCLTKKGAQFLRGDVAIPKYAIRSKIDKATAGYFEPERLLVHIDDFNLNETGGFWEGINYDINEGRVFIELPSV